MPYVATAPSEGVVLQTQIGTIHVPPGAQYAYTDDGEFDSMGTADWSLTYLQQAFTPPVVAAEKDS